MFNTSRAQEHIPEELQLFDQPTVMSSISDAYSLDILPVNQSYNAEVIEFLINLSDHYLSPAETILYLKCSIDKERGEGTTATTVLPSQTATAASQTSTGDAAAAGDDERMSAAVAARDKLNNPAATTTGTTDAAPVNALFYALFDRCEVELNGTPLDFGFKDYAYKAYFNILLSHTKEMKKTVLRNAMWVPDTVGAFDDLRRDSSGKNLGFSLDTKLLQRENPLN